VSCQLPELEAEQLERQFQLRLTSSQSSDPLSFVGSILLIAEASASTDAGEYRAQFVAPTAGTSSPRARSPARRPSPATVGRERSPSQPELQLQQQQQPRVLLESGVSHLNVSTGPLSIDAGLGDQTAAWGTPIELKCHVRPPPLAPDTVAVWIKDSVPIEVSARRDKFRCALTIPLSHILLENLYFCIFVDAR
jgi:hypothetical protein